eukprot:1161467-Pelagomonas_calceolata.AAC.4
MAMAASRGATATMLHLLRLGASATRPLRFHHQGQSMYFTPLQLAVFYNLPDFVEHLLGRGDVRAERAAVYKAFYYATTLNRAECMQAFLSSGSCSVRVKDIAGNTPLHVAARLANVEAVQVLLSHGHAQCKVRNLKGVTPLHATCLYIDQAVQRGRLEEARAKIVQILLDADCSVIDVQKDNGLTPLAHAACNDLPECCEVLLRAGSQALYIKGQNSRSPIDKLRNYTGRVRGVLHRYAFKLK